MTEAFEMSTPVIVVGLDDSPSARAALTFAAGYARTSGATLCAVHVSSVADQFPAAWSTEYVGVGYLDVPDRAAHRAKIQALFDSTAPETHWRMEFVEGGYGQALVERAAEAMLLVVGTHEHTGLGRILSGSVSHYCLSHAPCPVVAVPADSQHRPASRRGHGHRPVTT